MPGEANLVSFVLRFVEDEATEPAVHPVRWHGVIRHVQSNHERHFTRWTDALAFIAQYVDVGQDESPVAPSMGG